MSEIHTALRALYRHAEGNMSAEELQDLGCLLTDEAEVIARRSGDVTEKLACLISVDGDTPTGAGNFQSADEVFTLLCMLAHEFNTVAAMLDVGQDASLKARLLRGEL